MKKRTAKRLIVALIFSYVILITGVVVYWLNCRSNDQEKQTLSEAIASDNSDFSENEETKTEERLEENKEQPTQVIENSNEDESEITQITQEMEKEEEPVSQEPISMAFTGDVYLGNYVSSVYDAKGIQAVLSDSLLDTLQAADIAMVNQEFPFSLRGQPMENKQYTFRVNPEKISAFKKMGIDLVSLANNHALDYGTDALLDSMQTLTEAGITYVGVGATLEEAKTTRYVECRGKNIAVLSASRVIPVTEWGATSSRPGMFTTYDPAALIEEIKKAKEVADYVVVYVHWGIERKEYPEKYQRVMGKQFIDAGADLVIGSHPHVLQGFEYYNNKLIVYSLGNFIFSQTIPQTALLSVEVDEQNNAKVKVTGCETVNGKTMELSGEKEKNLYEYLSSISEKAYVTEEGYIVSKE